MKNTKPKTLFIFKQVSIPVETWGKHRGQSTLGDVIGYKIGEGSDELAGEFFILNAMSGKELSVREETFHSARPATNSEKSRGHLK